VRRYRLTRVAKRPDTLGVNPKIFTALIEAAAGALGVVSSLLAVLMVIPKVIAVWRKLFKARKETGTHTPFCRWHRFLRKKVKERTAKPW
jgi:UPF0716 family protein affecting phage T7 exclusion